MAKRKNYPGTIEVRGDSRRVILYVDGKRHVFNRKEASKEEAEAFAREKYQELQEFVDRARSGLPGALALPALLTRYETQKLPLLASNTRRSYSTSLRLFRRFLRVRRMEFAVHEFRSAHVKDFLDWARVNPMGGKGPSSNRTLQRHRAVLHAVFSFAEELELRDGNPVTKVKPPKADGRDPVILSEDQFEALLEASAENKMLRLYVLLLAETGMRSGSEALWLRWEDIDLEEGFLWVASGRQGHRTKSGKGRWVPLTPRLREALREHAAAFRMQVYGGERSSWVFHQVRSRRRNLSKDPGKGALIQAGTRIRTLRRAFVRAAEEATLPDGFTQHDLRHRRATSWLAEGKNPVHVKEALGHADLRTTMLYTHLAREHLRSLVDRPKKEELKEMVK